MSIREACRGMAELKKAIQARYPETILREGPGFEGGPKDVYLYAFTDEDKMDNIIEMSSPRIIDILLQTDVYVHVIPLLPGTMTWLWDNGAQRKPRRAAARKPRVLAQARTQYKTRRKK